VKREIFPKLDSFGLEDDFYSLILLAPPEISEKNWRDYERDEEKIHHCPGRNFYALLFCERSRKVILEEKLTVKVSFIFDLAFI